MNVFIGGPRAGEIIHDDEARQIVSTVQSRGPEAFYNQARGPVTSHHVGAPGYGAVNQEVSAQTQMLRELERKKRMMASAVGVLIRMLLPSLKYFHRLEEKRKILQVSLKKGLERPNIHFVRIYR